MSNYYMSNYCDFNPRKFKPFTSKKKKIIPAMSDDWTIVPTKYVSLDGFSLYSHKLKQEVADIDLYRFLRFCQEQGLVIDTLRLKGNYIVGNDRSVYTEEMYNVWRDKFEKRTETIISKNDAIPGHKYKTPCGKSIIYMGARYISRIQFTDDMDLNNYAKVSKVHFVIDSLTKESWHNTYQIEIMKNKITIDEGEVASVEEIDEIMKHFYDNSHEFVVFSKERPSKDFEVGLVEVPITDLDKNSYIKVLVIESGGKLYSGDGHRNQRVDLYLNDHNDVSNKIFFRYYRNNDKSKSEGWWGKTDTLFDGINLIKGGQDTHGGYYHRDNTSRLVEKVYRLGIVE